MGSKDYIMSEGDHVMGTDGNYETTETASGKMQRLFNAKKDRWPAQAHDSDLAFGRNYRERAKWSERSAGEWMADAEDCFQPLVQSGDITDLEITEEATTKRWAPRFRIQAKDIRENRKIDVDTTPWGS